MLIDKSKRKPVEEYLKYQGRFSKLSNKDIKKIQDYVEQMWEEIKGLIKK